MKLINKIIDKIIKLCAWQGANTEIEIFTTGGTIDKFKPEGPGWQGQYIVGKPTAEGMLKKANVNFDYLMASIMSKDSVNMTSEDRQVIFNVIKASRCKYIVVTHGTDAMVKTAKKLEGIEDKVIVLTGSFKPSRCNTGDAGFNFGFAIAAVQLLKPGVYIAMNGNVFDPNEVRKNPKINSFEYII
jgi:L-asparaginase